jgi:hypothetical protein
MKFRFQVGIYFQQISISFVDKGMRPCSQAGDARSTALFALHPNYLAVSGGVEAQKTLLKKSKFSLKSSI